MVKAKPKKYKITATYFSKSGKARKVGAGKSRGLMINPEKNDYRTLVTKKQATARVKTLRKQNKLRGSKTIFKVVGVDTK